MLRLAPYLTVALFLVPIAAGIAGTLLPAFGHLPALGRRGLSLDPWRALLDYPGFAPSVGLTVWTGLAATAVSLAVVVAFCAHAHGSRWFHRAQVWLAPVLATPHAAMAIGLAFLLAPSGWLARLLSPWATGWQRPPDLATVGDPLGIALIVGLAVKETAFLLLMTLAALNQVRVREMMLSARALGYTPASAWIKAVLPQVYPQIRLPLYAVLAFSLSAVDVALILGPNNPPPLSPLVVRWFSDHDLAMYFPGAAGAILQLLIVVLAVGGWRVLESLAARVGRIWVVAGGRGSHRSAVTALSRLLLPALAAFAMLAMAGMTVWSFAASWRFPDAVPPAWTVRNWMRSLDAVANPLWTTLVAGVVSTLVAAILSLACLENEQRHGVHPGQRSLWLLYMPLLVPQIAFLFGVQVVLVRSGLDGTWLALVWAHLLFVLPYVFLSLADPYRALDPRLARAAACLGASPARVFVAVKLPVLLRPLLAALAIGFAVSVGQYLSTLFAGAGRLATLTTEAVTLAAGSDRRVISVYAVLQAMLPLAAYVAAVALPVMVHRRRRGMRVD